MGRVTGGDKIRARIRLLRSPAFKNKVGQALLAGGERVAIEAQLSLTRGAGSFGRHVPSKPGDPPNQNTGVLGNNIEAVRISALRVEVRSGAPYSTPLEFGTSKMAARPFMKPALKAKRDEVERLVAGAIRSAF